MVSGGNPKPQTLNPNYCEPAEMPTEVPEVQLSALLDDVEEHITVLSPRWL